MHGTTNQIPLQAGNAISQRISALTVEYIDASPERQTQIDQEVAALIDGTLVPLQTISR